MTSTTKPADMPSDGEIYIRPQPGHPGRWILNDDGWSYPSCEAAIQATLAYRAAKSEVTANDTEDFLIGELQKIARLLDKNCHGTLEEKLRSAVCIAENALNFQNDHKSLSAPLKEAEPVCYQYEHYDAISGEPFWSMYEFRNGYRSREKRPLYLHPSPTDADALKGEEKAERLSKRPVEFRVNAHGNWLHFEDERMAQESAEMHGVDYQGLYVRDGTPLVFEPAPARDPFRPAVDVDADDDFYPSREEQ